MAVLELDSDVAEGHEEAQSVVRELGGLQGMEEDVDNGDASEVELEMSDEAVNFDAGSVENRETEYEDCRVENDPSGDEDDDDAVARVFLFGCPALLDAELKGLVVFSYTCIKDDGAEIGEGPKVALEKLLSKLSASVVLDMEFG